MEQNELQYNQKFYKLTHGTSMGNPLSCFISNAFIGHLETSLRRNNKLPKIWFRYVDDVFAVTKHTEIEQVLNTLNSQYDTIKFTKELENEKTLSFLDLAITRKNNGIDINIYRKPTNTKRFITNDSHTSRNIKHAAFNSMVYRLCRFPLSIQNYMSELAYIKNIANINGYDERLVTSLVRKHSKAIKKQNLTTLVADRENIRRVKCCFEPRITNKLKKYFKKHNMELVFSNNNKLQNIICNTKDKIPNLQKSGIYQIDCGDCERTYIGQTKRTIHTRFKEHIAHIKYNRPTKSAIAAHTLQKGHLNIGVNNLSLLKAVNDKNQLDAWESLYINKYKAKTLNIDEEPIISTLFKTICRQN
jgi:hypothetical protein